MAIFSYVSFQAKLCLEFQPYSFYYFYLAQGEKSKMSGKRVFVVAEPDTTLANQVANILRTAFEAVVYVAADGADALVKLRNSPPSLLVADIDLGTKISLGDIVRISNEEPPLQKMPILVFSDIPDSAPRFVNELNSGRMKFLSVPFQEAELVEIVKASLAATEHSEFTFKTLLLKTGQSLFKEGDESKSAFLLKSGRLSVSRDQGGKGILLGEVYPGEFVGEMAHITGEPRSANVSAAEDSELVEIPCGTLDLLIFSKPTWTKALLKTFAHRLRETNRKMV
jgi:CRP/FNR family cyclic AMP-dependent transcriptional regulator